MCNFIQQETKFKIDEFFNIKIKQVTCTIIKIEARDLYSYIEKSELETDDISVTINRLHRYM